MIFRPFASSSEATTIHSDEVNPVGLAEENGREGPKKGDFNRQMSFATGSQIEWFADDGTLLSTQPFEQGKPHGEGRQYYASGALYRIDRFNQGLRDGEQKAFYENGVLKTVTHYVDGVFEGLCVLYWPNGKLKREVLFKKGLRIEDRFWDEL